MSSIAGLQEYPAAVFRETGGRANGLPAETVDHITDFLWDDKESLAVASLVSKQWLHSTTHHLFKSIKISDDSRCDRFSQFIGLLRCRKLRDVSRYVWALHLQSRPLPKHRSTSLVNIDAELLGQMLRELPSLKHLHLSRVRWYMQDGGYYPLVLAPSVSRLTLSYRWDDVVPDFPAIFYWLPNVRECVVDGGNIPSLDSYRVPKRKYADPLPFPYLLGLRAMHVQSPTVSPWIWESLSSTAAMRSLQSVDAVLGRPEELYGLAQVLSAARDTLCDLRLDLTSSDYRMFFLLHGAVLGDRLPLHECYAIRRLKLTTIVVETSTVPWEGPPITTTPQYIKEIICSIPSQTFTRLTLVFKGSVHQAKHHLAVAEWHHLDEVLLAHPTICEVEVEWEDSWNIEGIEHLMCYIFFGLYQGRKLRFRQ